MKLFKQLILFMGLSLGIVNAAIPDCQRAYDNCMSKAGSNLEKTVCKDSYNKCIQNC